MFCLTPNQKVELETDIEKKRENIKRVFLADVFTGYESSWTRHETKRNDFRNSKTEQWNIGGGDLFRVITQSYMSALFMENKAFPPKNRYHWQASTVIAFEKNKQLSEESTLNW